MLYRDAIVQLAFCPCALGLASSSCDPHFHYRIINDVLANGVIIDVIKQSNHISTSKYFKIEPQKVTAAEFNAKFCSSATSIFNSKPRSRELWDYNITKCTDCWHISPSFNQGPQELLDICISFASIVGSAVGLFLVSRALLYRNFYSFFCLVF